MPEIEWNLPKEFRRAFSDTLRTWDFRDRPELRIHLPPEPKVTPKPLDIVADTLRTVDLKAEVVIRREAGSLPRRVFVVQPAGPTDRKLIDEWVERRLTSREWMMGGML